MRTEHHLPKSGGELARESKANVKAYEKQLAKEGKELVKVVTRIGGHDATDEYHMEVRDKKPWWKIF